jgi:hypothetical protein
MQYALTNGWVSHWVAKIGEPFGSWLHFGIWVTDIKQYEGRDDTNKHL